MPILFPWLSLVAIIWIQSISCTNSDFPAYSSLLKSRLGISQVRLNNLAFASDAGKLFGWCPGFAATRFPLWSILAVGLTFGFVGYGAQFLFLVDKIPTLPYWTFFLLQVLAGNSICWFNTACYVGALQKFPVDRVFVSGLATSYTGLSVKIYIVVARVINGASSRNGSTYLLLNCFVPAGVGLATAPFLGGRKQVVTEDAATATLLAAFVLAGATGTYAVVETLAPILGNAKVPPTVLLVMVGMVAGLPLLKAWQKARGTGRVEVRAIADEGEAAAAELAGKEAEEGQWENCGKERFGHRVWELLKNVEFWLYFLVYLCGGTMGLVYSNNLGQIAESRGVDEAILLSLSSSFGFFGKLSSASMSAFRRSDCMVSRPAFVALLMVPMDISFFLLLSPSKACLFVGTAVIGICTGAITSIAVSLTSDLFGTENFGVNHSIVVANIPIGSLLFGYIAAAIYDREGGGDRGGSCMGIHCYSTTFIIWGSICSFGTILSFVLYIRTRKLQ